MSKRNIGKEILKGIREIKKHKAGLIQLRTQTLVKSVRAKRVRHKTGGSSNQ